MLLGVLRMTCGSALGYAAPDGISRVGVRAGDRVSEVIHSEVVDVHIKVLCLPHTLWLG